MTDLSSIRLLATHPHPCSYLPEEDATTVFVDPAQPMNGELYRQLSELGFRRSGGHVYRPQCAACQACIPARIPVSGFRPNRRQKRCWKRNQDLSIRDVGSIDSREHYELYARYITERHRDGDMYPPSRSQFRTFLTSEWGITRFLEMRLENRLIAVAVCDQIDNAFSAVYTYFDPDFHSRSLGSYAILLQIERARQEGLHYVYLGYWIKASPKMSYKSEYRPFEVLINHRWTLLR
ncbi:arginyltransferase [Gilvimarinus sp. F26214L]|uniref:arginyltransferase n=1 Tax=Gilvimarinus sp. DZF01 TaxID=3461371 RepID=UPI00404676AE